MTASAWLMSVPQASLVEADVRLSEAERLADALRELRVDAATARQLDAVEWAEAGDKAQVFVLPETKRIAIALLEMDEGGFCA